MSSKFIHLNISVTDRRVQNIMRPDLSSRGHNKNVHTIIFKIAGSSSRSSSALSSSSESSGRLMPSGRGESRTSALICWAMEATIAFVSLTSSRMSSNTRNNRMSFSVNTILYTVY